MDAMQKRITGGSEEPIKVCVVGPKGCGKTSVSRALAEWDPLTLRYNPTVGVRIQEVERKLPRTAQARPIQLWDCSGDLKYQSCWPAMAKDAQGLLLVYKLDLETESIIRQKELERWYHEFGLPNKLPNSCCKIVALSDDPKIQAQDFPDRLGSLEQVVACITDGASRKQLFAALDFILSSIEEDKLKI